MKISKKSNKRAVALQYLAKETKAPRVIANGAGEIAQKIIDVGNENQIPVVEDDWMIKMLYPLQPGDVIPVALYQPVAKLLAYIYLFKKKAQNLSRQNPSADEVRLNEESLDR